MRRGFAAWLVGFPMAILALGGCNGGVPMADVTGTVTLDGKPIEDGAINFFPADLNGPATGGWIENGDYAAKVPLGVMKVTITAPKIVGRKKLYNRPDSPERPVTAERLPARYNLKSELTLTVVPGQNLKDWDLKSD